MTFKVLVLLSGWLLLTAAISASDGVAQGGTPVLVLADGPEGTEKGSIDLAAINGTEWFEAPVVENGLTMHVLYRDPEGAGFRDATLGAARRARLYDALRYVADTLNANGELNVMIGFSDSDGSGPLAQAGPMFDAEDGLTNGTVFDRVSSGDIPFAGYAEMSLSFDWGWSWHLGAGAPPSNTVDMMSVAVHEITHCLGFMSLIAQDGSSRFSSYGKNTYTVFDSLLAQKPGFARLLGGTSTEPAFAADPTVLTGGAVVFAGATALAVFGAGPSIYSSSPFSQGSSMQHWTQNSIPGVVVMEPRYSYGAARREYADVEIAALRDIGWTDAQAPYRAPCALQSVAFLQPSQNILAADASNTALVHFRTHVTLGASDTPCSMTDDVLRVAYFVDGVSRGVSLDAGGDFPLDLTLNAGTHTVRASATRTDSSEGAVESEMAFSITSAELSAPKIEVVPMETAKNFGKVSTNGYSDAAYIVRNIGGGTLTGAASLSGDPEFQFVGASTYSLTAGAESTVTVRFSPDKSGNFSGILLFGGNGGSVSVNLTGSNAVTDGALSCAGGPAPSSTPAGDLLVALLAMLALAGSRRRRVKP